jgi:hypothetical protein
MRKNPSLVLHQMMMTATSLTSEVKVSVSFSVFLHILPGIIDLPTRTPNKKQDEESVSSGKREADSPVLKKAPVTLQLRSKYLTSRAVDYWTYSSAI